MEFLSSKVGLLFSCGISGIGCVLINIPLVQIVFLLIFLCCGMAGNVVCASAVELYPTTLRWDLLFASQQSQIIFESNSRIKWLHFYKIRFRAMAMCIALMFARLGGMAGANISANLLDNYCEAVFFLPGLALIGKSLFRIQIFPSAKYLNLIIICLLQDARFCHFSFQTSIRKHRNQKNR